MNFNLLIHVKKTKPGISKYTKNSQLKRELVEKYTCTGGNANLQFKTLCHKSDYLTMKVEKNKHNVILKSSAYYAK